MFDIVYVFGIDGKEFELFWVDLEAMRGNFVEILKFYRIHVQ